MEPKWVQDYDLHKTRGEIEWLPEGEVPWKDEFGELEKKALEARTTRLAENKEKEEMDKIEAKKKELLAKFDAKKKREAMEEELREMSKALGEEIPTYVATVAAPKPEPVKEEQKLNPGDVTWFDKADEKPVEVKAKKKIFGKQKVDDGS